MKIWNGKQGGPEWHNSFRKFGCGASEVAKVLGVSKYGSSLDVWERLTDRSFPMQINEHMARGIELEPEARAKFEEIIGLKFPALCGIHDTYPMIRCSFDGVSECRKYIAEFKVSNIKQLFDAVKENNIEKIKSSFPDYYYQCLYQLTVNEDAEFCYFVIYQNQEIAYTKVPRDDEFINETLIPTVVSFWNNHVLTDVAPEAPEDAYVYIDDPRAIELSGILYEALETARNAKAIADQAKKELIELTDDGNSIIGKIKLTKTYGEKVNYKAACDDAGLDLSKYKSEYIRWTPRRIK